LKIGNASRKTKMKIRITTAIERKAIPLITFSANQSENLNFFLLKVTI
jgi:hypothetical protein